MENQSNQATKKGIILLLGIIIGLLVGVLVAFIVESKIKPKNPPVVNVVTPESQGSKDTVYKYIVHQYQPGPADDESDVAADNPQIDSLYAEESSMNYLLDDDDPPVKMDRGEANVTSAKLISKSEVPVIYFDANKNATKVPENAPEFIEIQFWSTPIQNKEVYLFEDNVLKIKGLVLDSPKLIHYNQRYYLQNDRRIYLVQPTAEYKRLTEIHDAAFLK